MNQPQQGFSINGDAVINGSVNISNTNSIGPYQDSPLIPVLTNRPSYNNNNNPPMNGNANRNLTAKAQIDEMKNYFSRPSRSDSIVRPLKFSDVLQESQNDICRTLPDASLTPVVRELQRGFAETRVLTDLAAEAILQQTLTPSQRVDKLVEYLRNDPRLVVCQKFLDALEKLGCYGVLQILYDSFTNLKQL